MYPKSKSPLESKYERLRGMCSGAGENVRYIPIDNGIQQHGRAWRYTVGVVCISVYQYISIQAAWRQDSTVYQRNSGYTCVWYANTVYTRHHQSFATPGCVYRACVRACVILLYYYIIIFIYTQYIQYIKYTQQW